MNPGFCFDKFLKHFPPPPSRLTITALTSLILVAAPNTEGSLVLELSGVARGEGDPKGKESREVFLATTAPCWSSALLSPFPFLLAPLCADHCSVNT